MVEDRNKANRLGGPYMIQDRDHMSEVGQTGGEVRHGSGRQVEQSQGDTRQQGSGQHSSSGQQGGERSHKRRKLL